MIFKRTLLLVIFHFIIITFMFIFAIFELSKRYQFKYLLPIIIIIYTSILLYYVFHKNFYEISENKIKIFNGKDYHEMNINEIIYININSFEHGRKHLVAIHDIAYIVTSDRRFKISTSLRNENNKSIVDILVKKYKKKLKYDS